MTNVVIGVSFAVIAVAVVAWRTIGAARTVVVGEAQPSASAQTGIAGGDDGGIAAGVDGGTAGGDGGGAGPS